MPKRSLAALAAALLLAACASSGGTATADARSSALDPVGTYDFSTNVEGTPVNGVITITRGDSGYGGSLATDVTETIPVTAVVVEGQKIMVTASSPDGPVNMAITMNGAEFTGSWSFGGMSGTMNGRKRS